MVAHLCGSGVWLSGPAGFYLPESICASTWAKWIVRAEARPTMDNSRVKRCIPVFRLDAGRIRLSFVGAPYPDFA